jgi:hypothetical protein
MLELVEIVKESVLICFIDRGYCRFEFSIVQGCGLDSWLRELRRLENRGPENMEMNYIKKEY